MSKNIKTRIQNKHDIEKNWQAATGFVPLAGEIIIYDADSTHTLPRVKIGDGTTLVNSLKFVDADIAAHIIDTVKHITAAERTSWNAASTHAGSAHAPSNAEKNQNAFSNVVIGSTTIAADTTTDTITLVAGSNITLTPDASNDKITIAATDTDTHYKAVPHAGSSSSTAATATTNGNTYINIVENGTRSGGINIKGAGTTSVTSDSNGVITINSTDTNADTKVTSVDNHYAPVADAAAALSVDASNATAAATWGTTNLVTGVNIKRDAKGHVTGLTVDSIKMPVNPDTDTHYTTGLKVGTTASATSNAAAANGNVYLNVLDNSTVRDSHKITGSGATTVTSDADGTITIASTAYSTGTATTSGLTKLYSSTGNNADGTMTQRAITEVISNLISSGTTDPDTSTIGQFYFKYSTE